MVGVKVENILSISVLLVLSVLSLLFLILWMSIFNFLELLSLYLVSLIFTRFNLHVSSIGIWHPLRVGVPNLWIYVDARQGVPVGV